MIFDSNKKVPSLIQPWDDSIPSHEFLSDFMLFNTSSRLSKNYRQKYNGFHTNVLSDWNCKLEFICVRTLRDKAKFTNKSSETFFCPQTIKIKKSDKRLRPWVRNIYLVHSIIDLGLYCTFAFEFIFLSGKP